MEKALYLDVSRCVGCGACVVACMDQNDIYPELGQAPFRRIYQVEDGHYPDASIGYVSASCNHCEDSPCLIGCPTGAIYRHEITNAVVVDPDRCIGCHSCALACPFGVPRYDGDDKLNKCNQCAERVRFGLRPACVKTCPTEALKFEMPNKVMDDKEQKYITGMMHAVQKTVKEQ